MNGPRGYYAKRNKQDRGKEILYDFTYTWNLRNKTNEQIQPKIKQMNKYDKGIGKEYKYVVAREMSHSGRREIDEEDCELQTFSYKMNESLV